MSGKLGWTECRDDLSNRGSSSGPRPKAGKLRVPEERWEKLWPYSPVTYVFVGSVIGSEICSL